MTLYTNPRLHAVVENWPHGGKRVTATFSIEVNPKLGERAVRVTTGAPRKLTYAVKARIVDGDDGKIYIAELSRYNHITIMRGSMDYIHETVLTANQRHTELRALFT